MLIAYNRAKVAAYRITGRNWNPSTGRSGNGGQLVSRVSRSSPSVPSGSNVKNRQVMAASLEVMAASLGHLACDTGTIRSSGERRSVACDTSTIRSSGERRSVACDTSTIRSSGERRSVGSIMVQVDRRPSSDLNGYRSHPFLADEDGKCDEQQLLPSPGVDTLRPTSDQFRPSRISMSPIGKTHLYRSVNDVSITMATLPTVSSSNMSRSVGHSIGHISGHFSEAQRMP